MNIRMLTISLCLPAVFAATGIAQDFTLREELGRQWNHEYVTFPLTSAQLQKAKVSRALAGPGGKRYRAQLVDGANDRPRIAFQTNLAPFATAKWRFDDDVSSPLGSSDLKLEQTAEKIRITNAMIGIELTRNPKPGAGPIAGIRLKSGTWVGTSRLVGDAPVSQWELEVTESGAVVVEVVCRATFGNKGTWELRFRMYSGEPVVLIDETFSVNAKATLQLILNDRFPATELFYRTGKGRVGRNTSTTIKQGNVFVMEPWLQWWAEDRRGSTFSLFHKQSTDLLTIAARQAGAWVDPELPSDKRVPPLVQVRLEKSNLSAAFPLAHGARKWLIGTFDRDASLAVLKDEKQAFKSPIPYDYLVKHGHFPLDTIKDYVLRWPSSLNHPRLLITEADVKRFKAGVGDVAEYRRTVKYFLQHPQLLAAHEMDRIIPAFLATNDPELGKLLVQFAVNMLQQSVDDMIDQNGLPFGAAPHMNRGFAIGLGVADIVMDSPHMTQQTRDRIRALTAFLSYTIARPEYWSTERGYGANPNMTTSVSGYRARLAAFISDHPSAQQWSELGMTELRTQLHDWSDENGGWLEAPHYAVVAYDEILGMLVTAANAGFNDWLYTDPKVKKVIRWLAKTSTPPDSRIGGYRHLPPIGNTYVHEACGEYGLLAYLFRDRDPEFSAEMQWMFNQNNRYGTPGIGGFHPTFAGYRKLLTDPDLPQRAPSYSSELFPETGVVLRDEYPSRRETYLHLIHGNNHEHYDIDSGSIILYGKGRILADEFGYNGRTPPNQHSMVETAQAVSDTMKVRDFVTGPRFDYVAGIKGGWTRQIAFVKGATPESPTYVLMNDSLLKTGAATWRLWLTGSELRVTGNLATMVGREDVDMELFFLSPAKVKLTTEQKTIQSGSGLRPDWNWGPMKTTQTGLISGMDKTAGWNVVLFPRLKGEQRPQFESLADGRGVKVIHSAGTDYAFLSSASFTFQDEVVQFQGMAGMAQIRGGKVVLAMGTKGQVRVGDLKVNGPR